MLDYNNGFNAENIQNNFWKLLKMEGAESVLQDFLNGFDGLGFYKGPTEGD